MTDAPVRITWKGRLIALSVGFVLSVLAAEMALRVVNPHWREYFSGWFMEYTFVEDMGAVRVAKPGFDGYFAQNNGDFRIHLKINDDGLRNPESASAADGQIWVVGDSMAFGWGVEREETYAEQTEAALGTPVYSVASPGANVCGYQRLVARMPGNIKPHAVVLGLILENDLAEYDCATESTEKVINASDLAGSFFSLSDFKQMLAKYSALYNFFAVSLKRIDVINELLIRTGLVNRSHQMRMAVPDNRIEPMVAETTREIQSLRAQLPPETPFVVLVAPTRFEMRDQVEGRTKLRVSMHNSLHAAGIETLDPFDAFMKHGYENVHFAHDGHWKVDGHRIASDLIADWMKRNLPQ
jgi:hypothetical protein